MWNGTAETLKASPVMRKTSPKRSPSEMSPPATTVRMPSNVVVPA
jgi:hypothetical protein